MHTHDCCMRTYISIVRNSYNNSVAFTDGTVATMARRGRPHLIFDDDTINGSKNIIGLTNGVIDNADPGEFGDKSFTLVTPVRQAIAY